MQIEKLSDNIALPSFTSTEQLAAFISNSFNYLPEELVINLAYHVNHIDRDGTTDGVLQKLGKVLMIESLIDKPIGKELEQTIFTNSGKRINISVGNDGLCSLMAGKNHFTDEELAFGIVGTGINFGFFLKNGKPVILESDAYKLPIDSSSSAALKKFGNSFAKQTEGWALYQRFNNLIQETGIATKPISSTMELDETSRQNIPYVTSLAQGLLTRSAQLVSCQIAGVANFKEQETTLMIQGGLLKGNGYRKTLEESIPQLTPYPVTFVEIENSEILGAALLVA